MSSTFVSKLMEMRAVLDGLIETQGASTGPSVQKKQKKLSTRAGKPTPHGDFTKKILAEHSAQFEVFKAQMKESNPEMKGIHLTFVGNYKKEHADEYKAFEAAWKEAHPKDAPVSGKSSDAGSDSDGESATAPSQGAPTEGAPTEGAKKTRVLSDEQKAKMKAGREKAAAEKKAAKEAQESSMRGEIALAPLPVTAEVPSPVTAAAPVPVKKVPKSAKKAQVVSTVPVVVTTEEDAPELLPFKHGGASYLRLGSKREDGNHLWSTGDLWISKKGAKGPYSGMLLEDGSIDADAEEPELS